MLLRGNDYINFHVISTILQFSEPFAVLVAANRVEYSSYYSGSMPSVFGMNLCIQLCCRM